MRLVASFFFLSLPFFSVVVLLFPNSNMIAAYSFSQLLRLLWCGSRAASFYRVAPRGVIDSRPRSIDYDYLKVRRCVIYRTGAAKIGAPRGSEEQQWIGIKRTDFKKQLAKEYRSSWAAHQQQGFLSFYFLPRKKTYHLRHVDMVAGVLFTTGNRRDRIAMPLPLHIIPRKLFVSLGSAFSCGSRVASYHSSPPLLSLSLLI